MKPSYKSIFMISSLSLLVFLMLVSIAMAVTYDYTIIDFPSADSTTVYGINDAGQIVGAYSTDGKTHGFLFDDIFSSTIIDCPSADCTTIDFPGAAWTIAYGINDEGQIIGSYGYSYVPPIHKHGFLFDGSSFTTIDYPGADYTVPLGINDAGMIVGSYPNVCGFLFDGSSFKRICIFDEDCCVDWTTRVYGINDAGQIVGTHAGYDFWGNECHYGFLDKIDGSSSYEKIGFPLGADWATFSGINDAGQIVGTYYYSDYIGHGFLFDGNSYTTIDYSGAAYTEVVGINDKGQIIGSCGGCEEASHSFVATPKEQPRLFVVIPGNTDDGDLMLFRAANMFRDDTECTIRICQSKKQLQCDLINPSPDQVRETIKNATMKAKEKGKDVIVNIDMHLNMKLLDFLWQYWLPRSQWQRAVRWAGKMANIVSQAFTDAIPEGERITYAHSAGVDAASWSIKLRPDKPMYDNLNLLNGRTATDPFRRALERSAYEWWQVKVFTSEGDLIANPLWSLSNPRAARRGAGKAWVHLHSLTITGHNGLRNSIKADGSEVAGDFEVNLGPYGRKIEHTTVRDLMLRDWRP